jgi:hypothetical protein
MTYYVKGTMPDGMIATVEVPAAIYKPRDDLEAVAIAMRIAPGLEPSSVSWDDGEPEKPV